ncbi:MAG TPA: BsuPI-related putative proteinase inhibitor [Candidatus Solibacter sp.]|nr:BsuPI-related putative proteinase inhibitor [Candidatus Solibacter sp.]
MTNPFHNLSFLVRAAGVASGLILTSALPGQTADYFPLETGNTWLYRSVTISGSIPPRLNFAYQTVRVTGTEKIGDRQYFQVSYFGRDLLLREDASTGDLFAYDRAAGAEALWVSTGLPVGSTFSSSIDPCSGQAQIASRDGLVLVGLEDLPNVVQVKFQTTCADAGVTAQYYAPGVGLIRQEQTTFAGPLVYRLIYYRAGARQSVTGDVAFTVAVDSPWYYSGGVLGARLMLRNGATDAVTLHFPSSQSYDLKILNDRGQAVYTWSADKLFAAVLHDEKLGPGELAYGATIPLDGLAPGHYTMQAFLTTDPIVYTGQVAFDVVALPGR